ncbi:MAG: TetR/AcrR family transcriptional regulator [Actinomycetota bacterium]
MSTLSRRERERQQRRNDIVEAAEALFSEKGFKGTTMQEISERVELSKGTIYLYFKSKEELYLSVCVKGVAGFGEDLEAAAASAGGIEDIVKAVYMAYIKHSLEKPAIFRVLRDTFIEQVRQNLSPETIEEISGYIKGWLELESGLLEEGIERGIFREDLDPYGFSLTAWRTSTGLIELALLNEPGVVEHEDLDRFFQQSIDLLVEGAKSGAKRAVRKAASR